MGKISLIMGNQKLHISHYIRSMSAQIFNQEQYLQLVKRIESLPPDAVRQWGTMDVAAMCWHCRQQLEMVLHPGTGKVLNTIFKYQPFRWMAIFVMPWPKGTATAPSMDATKNTANIGTVAFEKQKLLDALEGVVQLPNIEGTHPLFGSLGKKYWGRLIYKHLDHHLRQFNH